MDYVELRTHSAFSFGDGACTPETLVEVAARQGYGALGLTDRSDLGGVIRFALAARRAGIRPVVGAELVVDGHPLALLVRSAEGFRNLGALVTRSRMGDWGEWLEEKAALEAALIELAGRQGIPWVVSNDPRYVDGGSRLVHDLWTAHRADMDVDTAASWGVLHPNGEWRLKSPDEMNDLWKGREQGLEETARIADECAFDLKWVRPPLPKYPRIAHVVR